LGFKGIVKPFYDKIISCLYTLLNHKLKSEVKMKMISGEQVIGLVVGLIVCSFVLVIGMNIYYTGYNTIGNVVLGTAGNATRDALHAAVWGAFDMTTVLPTIMGGSAIIAALVIGFLIYRRR